MNRLANALLSLSSDDTLEFKKDDDMNVIFVRLSRREENGVASKLIAIGKSDLKYSHNPSDTIANAIEDLVNSVADIVSESGT